MTSNWRRKVCFLAGTLGQGGAERQLYYAVRALVRAGAKASVLSFTKNEFWEKPLVELGVRVRWIPHRSRLARLRRILRELDEDRPDVIQSQHFYTNAYASLAGRLLKIRDIGAIRNDFVHEVLLTGKIAGPVSWRLPRLLAANSRAAIRNAVAQGVPTHRLRLLKNVVDLDQFSPKTAPAKDDIVILTTGRLTSQKRHDRFLRLLASLRRRSRRTVRGIIAGNGPLREDLEAQASALHLLPDALEFRGAVGDMAELYRKADIFVLTSEFEGNPNVVLEAMASGLPVVATRVGDIPEAVFPGENGFLAEAGDEDGLQEGLMALTENPELRHRFGHKARSFVTEHHSDAALAERLEELYREALA